MGSGSDLQATRADGRAARAVRMAGDVGAAELTVTNPTGVGGERFGESLD